MEETNFQQDSTRVMWEILPGDGPHLFREITPEDIDPSVLTSGSLIDTDNFPFIPHPLLNPAVDHLDGVWAHTIIKIESEIINSKSNKNQECERVFDVTKNNKGLLCPFKLSRCQEGWCQSCGIYLNKPKP